jgi:hypothetical protein
MRQRLSPRTIQVSHSELRDLGPGSQSVAVQHQAGAYSPARGTAARTARGRVT